jgi:hypothetical protein
MTEQKSRDHQRDGGSTRMMQEMPDDVKQFDAAIMSRFPSIPWLTPIPVRLFSGEHGFACRLCVARTGLKGAEVKSLPKTAEEVLAHIESVHMR